MTLSRLAERRQQLAAGVKPHQAKQGIRTLESRLPRYAANVDGAQKGLVKAGAVRVPSSSVIPRRSL